eukprot:gene9648-16891_t
MSTVYRALRPHAAPDGLAVHTSSEAQLRVQQKGGVGDGICVSPRHSGVFRGFTSNSSPSATTVAKPAVAGPSSWSADPPQKRRRVCTAGYSGAAAEAANTKQNYYVRGLPSTEDDLLGVPHTSHADTWEASQIIANTTTAASTAPNAGGGGGGRGGGGSKSSSRATSPDSVAALLVRAQKHQLKRIEIQVQHPSKQVDKGRATPGHDKYPKALLEAQTTVNSRSINATVTTDALSAAPPRPRANYMEAQSFLNCTCSEYRTEAACQCNSPTRGYNLRANLVGWLFSVNQVLKFQPMTFHMAVRYVDRFLSVVAVRRSKLQLVGTTCMVLAAKYEEAKSVSVEQFVFLIGNRHTAAEIVKMETRILMAFNYDMHAELMTPLPAMDVLLKTLDAGEEACHYAGYIADLILLDGEWCLARRPTHIAVAVVITALCHLGYEAFSEQFWTAVSQYGLGLDDIVTACSTLHAAVEAVEPTQYGQSIYETYARAVWWEFPPRSAALNFVLPTIGDGDSNGRVDGSAGVVHHASREKNASD